MGDRNAMSAVTLQEIADLVAGRLKVPVAAMRGLRRGPGVGDEASARTARNVVVVLARRHTTQSYPQIADFFALVQGTSTNDRLRDVVATEARWTAGELSGAVEDVERQIDALHEKRMNERDRKVRV
jgi:chromosomal replication initiation ATPase DnaA